MVPIAATSQVSVMTHKNTHCPYGLFWKLRCGSWRRAAVLVVCLSDSLHCWDETGWRSRAVCVLPQGRTGGFGFWDHSGAQAQGLALRLLWRNASNLLLRCFCCHCSVEPCGLLCCIRYCRLPSSTSALWEWLVPSTWGKTVAREAAISLDILVCIHIK